MNNKIIYRIGILGVSLFVTASIVGGLLIEDYSVTSQYISESFAIDTVYGGYLRSFGYIPSGILIIVFCFYGSRTFQSLKLTKIGFLGLGIFYGLATIMVGLFPCDSGCNKEFINPSISQIIHNIAALLTYVFVPASLILVGIGLKKLPNFQRLSIQIITYGILSFFLFVGFFPILIHHIQGYTKE